MTSKECEALFSQFETKIREGAGLEVRTFLLNFNAKEIPRSHLARYCNLARRTGLSSLCLRLLYPIVRSTEGFDAKPSFVELTEYAAALSEMGAVGEAKKILSKPETLNGDLRAYLMLSFCLFRNWQYEEAIPLLKKYIELNPEPYANLVGRVNLCAALVTTSHSDEAGDLIYPLLQETKKLNHMLLHGNLLELAGQVEFQRKNHSQALQLFSEAQTILKGTGNQSLFYVQKWSSIIVAQKKKNLHDAFLAIAPLMLKAKSLREWETLRDIDRHLGAHFQDEYLAQKLFYGSPFADFQKSLGKLFPNFSQPDSFFFCHRWRSAPVGPILEVHSLRLTGSDIVIKPGAQLHRLFHTLLTDFYRPFSIAMLFTELFPDEYYNPFSTQERVSQCIKRLRQVFVDNNLPIEIRQSKHEYQIKVTGEINLKIRRQDLLKKTQNLKEQIVVESLKEFVQDNIFSVKDLMTNMGTSLRTANRIVKEHLDKGLLIKIGKSRNTRYKLVG